MAAGPRWPPSVCIGYRSYFTNIPAISAVDEGQETMIPQPFPFFRSSPLITKVAKPQRVFTKPWGENCRNLRNVSSAMALIKGSWRRPILALERESDSHHLKVTLNIPELYSMMLYDVYITMLYHVMWCSMTKICCSCNHVPPQSDLPGTKLSQRTKL